MGVFLSKASKTIAKEKILTIIVKNIKSIFTKQ
jgi:hypothetical protein